MKRISLPSARRLLPAALRLCGVASILAIIAGCQGEGPKVGLKSDDPAGRMIAMKQAGQRHDPRAVPDLIDDLSSDDPAERFYASGALERITGQTFGYRYYDTEEARAQAIERWKQWLGAKNPAATRRAP